MSRKRQKRRATAKLDRWRKVRTVERIAMWREWMWNAAARRAGMGADQIAHFGSRLRQFHRAVLDLRDAVKIVGRFR